MKIKRFMIFLLTLVMVFSSTATVFAKEIGSGIDQSLRARGVPEELIEIMPENQKKEIISQNLMFDSYKEFTLNEISDGSDIQIQATIPTDKLSFYCSTYKSYPWNTTNKSLIVYCNYDWITNPLVALTDCFGIAWDGNLWRAVPNSYYQQTSYDIREWPDMWRTYTKTSFDYALAYASYTGAGWNTNIKHYWGLDMVQHNYGYGRIAIEAIDPRLTGTSQICLNYSHATGLGSVGLEIGILSVSYSGSAGADTRGDYINFTY